ncbi:MAG TPA: type III pantothenate kinase [Nitrospirales bacterium]|nr:type III pantothenate kinase [Nitrospirales bacterium]HIC04162.1 type III pantothenate kinase [Nitrospirales bacterium]HIN32399.1 type III pantothenate kinase [Nitrospirales bacterium]HIO70266.1 type III pantothenate kinase [Nitrospirales bacterium]
MLLTIDIGNTNVIAGVFDGDRLIAHWRVATDYARTADEYGITFLDVLTTRAVETSTIRSVILSSVVPPLTPAFGKMSQNYFHTVPLIVTSDLDTGLTFRFEQPQEIGSDRIVNAAAAYARYGGPIIVVDFGTAITFCVVTKDGEYLGGAIAPGIRISADALAQRAAKLSSVELTIPKEVIGHNTASSIQSGLIYGFAGMVDGLVRRIKMSLGQKCRVVATGGQAALIAPIAETIDEVRDLLTLEGLELLYRKNQSH